VVKVRLQIQHVAMQAALASGAPSRPPLYTGPVDCAVKILRVEGVRGLFRGWTPLVARDVPFNSLFFGCYNAYSKALVALQSWRYPTSAPSDKLGPVSIVLAVRNGPAASLPAAVDGCAGGLGSDLSALMHVRGAAQVRTPPLRPRAISLALTHSFTH
jgi:hypothetical protein